MCISAREVGAWLSLGCNHHWWLVRFGNLTSSLSISTLKKDYTLTVSLEIRFSNTSIEPTDELCEIYFGLDSVLFGKS